MKACSLPRERTEPQAGATAGRGAAVSEGRQPPPRPLPALLASSLLKPRSYFAYGAEWPPPDSSPSLTSPLEPALDR